MKPMSRGPWLLRQVRQFLPGKALEGAVPNEASENGCGVLRWLATESMLPEVAALLCLLALLWSSIVITLDREYDKDKTVAEQTTGNLARAFEESTRRTIGQLDQVLLGARAFYAAQGPHFNFDQWASTQTLPDKMTAAIGMADATGHVFADTMPIPAGVSIADRPHFRAQLDPAHDDLYISQPVRGRVSGQETIQFTRKLLGPKGEFAGVTVFSLDCRELSRFYETVNLNGGFVALLLSDGTYLARGPLLSGFVGRRLSEFGNRRLIVSQPDAVITIHSKHANEDEIVSFRHLHDYPLIVMVGLNTDTAFQQYRSLRLPAILGGLGASLAVGLIGVFWLRQKRRSIASRRALSITLNTISQGILMVDRHGDVPVLNPRALDLLGVPDPSSTKAASRHAAVRATELAAQGNATDVAAASGDGAAMQVRPDTRFETAGEDGTVIEVRRHPLAEGGFVDTYTDVTEQRLADARVRFLAHHDALTGLPNRVQLRLHLQNLHDTIDRNELAAFIMIDLDGFKVVNDTLGHDIGDELLIEVSRRLQDITRQLDFVARLGGDEFVIMMRDLEQAEAAVPLVERVLRRLSDPTEIAGHRLRIGASAGLAFYPKDGVDSDALLKYADIALYAAKADGRGTFRCFDHRMTEAVNERRLLESGLRRALESNELKVVFQPIFATNSLEVAGFEALARWHHPERGYIAPDTFIRIAEECGLISRLGHWVIEQACTAAASWRVPCRIAVNVSPTQLRDGRFQDELAGILQQTGLTPRLLEIEVTENVMVGNNQTVLNTLRDLKRMGVRIALDDFGTGYSSLGSLRRFPFDKIKIDKSFVQGQSTDHGVRVILEAILDMCRNLDLPVVGEGVETQQQLALLRQNGCTEVQGFWLGRPIASDAMEEFLRGSLRPQRRGAGAAIAANELDLAS